MKQISMLFLLIVIYSSCKKKQETSMTSTDTISARIIKKELFGKLPEGQDVYRYTLTNRNNIEMQVINYGGIITALKVPDRNGKIEDIVLGYDSLSQYTKSSPYFGAIVGRYGNRIANGKFTLDGKTYSLAQNNNGQHLHGGIKGFDKVYWAIEEVANEEGPALKLSYASKDMEEGYPGNLNVEVLYVLTDSNELKLKYKATTDKKTVVNLTQHSYFNLTGNCKRDILSHELTLHADKFVPVDRTLIPLANLQSVANTPFDFRKPKLIGEGIADKNQQLTFGLGYDHCWVLSQETDVKTAGSLYDSLSGRYMEILTTEPGIQFYSGNFLDGTLTGKNGIQYKHRYGLCLETEHFPDSPNRADFPSVTLNPNDVYETATTYIFKVK